MVIHYIWRGTLSDGIKTASMEYEDCTLLAAKKVQERWLLLIYIKD